MLTCGSGRPARTIKRRSRVSIGESPLPVRRPAGHAWHCDLICIGGSHELLRPDAIRLDQTVARDHEVDQARANAGQIKKGLHGRRNRYPIGDRRLRIRSSQVRRHAGPASSLPGRHADMNVGRIGGYSSPQLYGCVMTHMRRTRKSLDDRAGSKPQVIYAAGADVRVVEEADEAGAEEIGNAFSRLARALALVRTRA